MSEPTISNAEFLAALLGSNTKPRYGRPPPRHRLHEWHPERAYSIAQIVEALGLDPDSVAGDKVPAGPKPAPPVRSWSGPAVIAELQRRHLYKAALGARKHDVTCPWLREHTDALDGGTCYWEPDAEHPRGGFKCQHGHCSERNIGDLLVFLMMASTKEEKGKSQATRVVELLEAGGVTLFHDPEGDAYAHLPGGATWPLRSRPFKTYLSKVIYCAEASAVGGQALEDAMRLLEAKGLHDGEEMQVPVRVAHHQGAVYLDLGDPTWRAIEVTAEGWRIVPGPELQVRFRRPKGALSLPEPERGGKLAELREHVNVPNDEAWALLAGFTVAAFVLPRGPFPILGLQGEHGSAKTTTSNRIAALLDPRISGLRALPHSLEVLAVGAHNSFLLGFDNISHLEPWLSDALCRISTGSGFATRQHYENKEEAIFEAARPVLLNGIESAATRGDLIDRTIVVELPRLSEEQRLTQREANRRFDAARPRVLAGLLDAVALALRNRDSVRLSAPPRMADFAEVAVAAEQAFAVPVGTFLAGYEVARSEGAETAVEADPVAGAVIEFMKDKSFWEGSASESLKALPKPEEARGWPRSANEMASQLKRAAPQLRKLGIEVAKPPRSSRGRRWCFKNELHDALRAEPERKASFRVPRGNSSDDRELTPVTPMTPSPAVPLGRLNQEILEKLRVAPAPVHDLVNGSDVKAVEAALRDLQRAGLAFHYEGGDPPVRTWRATEAAA